MTTGEPVAGGSSCSLKASNLFFSGCSCGGGGAAGAADEVLLAVVTGVAVFVPLLPLIWRRSHDLRFVWLPS